MQIRAGLRSCFFIALSIHAAILFLFTFTFAAPDISPKPVFIFLGSFLRQQDVLLPSELPVTAHAGFDIRQIRLDSNRNVWLPDVSKPSLAGEDSPDGKNQFKPKMAEAIAPSKTKKTDASDLGLDLEPLPPVKMKIPPQ